MAYSKSIREEELKNKVASDLFSQFDSTKIIGNIDFCISDKNNPDISYLWAEAKKGNNNDIYDSFVQLILTIGKEKAFDNNLPPPFLGAFDAEKIAFLPYHLIIEVFKINDFNWNVKPSDHATDEFNKVKEIIISALDKGLIILSFDHELQEIKNFIKNNFSKTDIKLKKIDINRNNFTYIYYKWLTTVKQSISINWEAAKKKGILDADFYLADVLSEENATLKDKLFVLLKHDHYEFDRSIDEIMGTISTTSASFKDGQKAHSQFWNLYDRPPKEEFWDFIVERRDLLVPQDVRERKGSFFTPQIWVELSQKYISDELGENWQDEYYIWDCAAGTGNLLTGLTNKYKIWASTLDQSDVDIMRERVNNGANLLESHIFKFDFLNDDFSQVPDSLMQIINDENKRKKLLIYINPPYAEAASTKTISSGENRNKTNVAVINKAYSMYKDSIGIAGRELFIQFLARIYKEIPGCKIAQFSKLKALQSPNFKQFRQFFKADLRKLFITPASTFDNVTGKFPIGFFIYDTSVNKSFKKVTCDLYDNNAVFIGNKKIKNIDAKKSINDWIISTRKRDNKINIGFLSAKGCDFQNQNYVYIVNDKNMLPHPRGTWITDKNLMEIGVYFAVRKVIKPTWINDRDQFLFPKNSWKTDYNFQNNCLIYTIFNTNIKSSCGTNYWIPFSENDIDAKDTFTNNFLYKYINGRIYSDTNLIDAVNFIPTQKLEFSDNANLVLDTAKNIWRYYNQQNSNANPDASLYDIKSYFQENDLKTGKLTGFSQDEEYNKLMRIFKKNMYFLSLDIIPKVYEHGFLES